MSSPNTETDEAAAFAKLLDRASTDAEQATIRRWRDEGRDPKEHWDDMASEFNNSNKFLVGFALFFGNWMATRERSRREQGDSREQQEGARKEHRR